MNLATLTAALDAATVILQEHNDHAASVDYWRGEIAQLEAVRDLARTTTDRKIANIRIGQAEFALLRLQMEQDEELRMYAEEQAGMRL